MRSGEQKGRRPFVTALSWVFLAFGLTATLALTVAALAAVRNNTEKNFQRAAQESVTRLNSTLQRYSDLLQGTASLFEASEFVDAEEFATYASAMELEERFPGLENLSWVAAVPESERESFQEQIASQLPGFTLMKLGIPGTAYVLTYLHPFVSRRSALGADLRVMPMIGEALEHASATQMPAMTDPIRLGFNSVLPTGDDAVDAITILAVPMADNSTAEINSGAVSDPTGASGWIVAPIRVQTLTESVMAASSRVGGLEAKVINDSGKVLAKATGTETTPGDATVEGDEATGDEATAEGDEATGDEATAEGDEATGDEATAAGDGDEGEQPAHTLEAELDTISPSWTVEVSSTRDFASAGSWMAPLLVFLSAIALTILGFTTLRVHASSRKKALQLVDETTQDLQESEERFRRLFTDAGTPQTLLDMDGRFLDVNDAMCETVGMPARDLRGRHIRDVLAPPEVALVADIGRQLAKGEIETSEGEIPVIRSDGRVIHLHMDVIILRDEEKPVFYVQCQDVTRRKEAEAELRKTHSQLEARVEERTADLAAANELLQHEIVERTTYERQLAYLATHDALTGMPNRSLLIDRLEQALVRLARNPGHVAVLYVDLDRFKLVNDSIGHAAGDDLLVAMAERIGATLRDTDTTARMGGDEFAVVCPDIGSIEAATELAGRILEALEPPLDLDGAEVFTTASIGVSTTGSPDADAERLLRDADAAMYLAKQRGRARWELFDESMRRRATARLTAETELRRAVDREELEVHYQPVVDLVSGRISGAEALLRWRRRDGRIIPAMDFIDLAEDSGIITEIGTWVLETVCAQAAAWHGTFGHDLTVQVNLSARQLVSTESLEAMRAPIGLHGCDPSMLCLEITERAFLESSERVRAGLETLKTLGVRIGIDDFGTHYSSLTYLKRFPFDEVKIDKSFVHGVGSNSTDTAIVTAVVHLAHALDMKVIAEGVETSQQAHELRFLGCPYAQGHWFAAAMPAASFESLLRGDTPLLPAELESSWSESGNGARPQPDSALAPRAGDA